LAKFRPRFNRQIRVIWNVLHLMEIGNFRVQKFTHVKIFA
jgi:hypothetical protein